jgi:hypothetical protein
MMQAEAGAAVRRKTRTVGDWVYGCPPRSINVTKYYYVITAWLAFGCEMSRLSVVKFWGVL